MFFNSWQDLLRIGVIGLCAYAALILLLRTFGKRTLAKLNAFDFVVTVALGSIFATSLLSKDVALAESLTAFAVLIVLQYIISWSSARSEAFQNIVKAQPTLLFYRGRFLHDSLRRERVSVEEVRFAMRQAGVARLEGMMAVVLETDGSITVLPSADIEHSSALENVHNYPPPAEASNDSTGTG